MKFLMGAVISLFVTVTLPVHAAGDAAAGEKLAGTCAACHGVDGNSVVAMWPKIAGQHEAYLDRQIMLIRDGDRPVPEMQGLVAGLSDKDISDLAAYFSAGKTSPGAADENLVAKGEKLYRAGNAELGVPACMSCHGPVGEGNPLAGYPSLSGQHSVYTVNMLKKFRNGDTWGEDDSSSTVMAGVSRFLSDEEIEAVASYVQGLHLNAE